MDKQGNSRKITIVGDIMCEPMLLKAAKRPNGYDFTGVFKNVRELFAQSDYVIGNLETPLAGPDAGYTAGYFSFNTPSDFAAAARDAGVDFLLTANNHCLDRGLDGLKYTLQELDRQGIAHTGTFLHEMDPRFHVVEIGDTRIAILAYTYGTNYGDNRIVLKDEETYHINLLRPQQEKYFVTGKSGTKSQSKTGPHIGKLLSYEQKTRLKKLLGQPYNTAHEDNNLIEETAAPYMRRLCADIAAAKQAADVVLFLPHIGGQFNIKPGTFSEYVFCEAQKAGCDAIVASHPHIVQKAAYKEKKVPCFFSIGNFSMSPNDFYLLHEHHPAYGLAVHLYLENKQIAKASFTVLKMVEKRGDVLTVYPVDELYDRLSSEKKRAELMADVQSVVCTVVGTAPSGDEVIQREYLLYK